MGDGYGIRPGTTSKLLWHFTGGPRWSMKYKRPYKRLKSAASSYEALIKILESRTLKLSS